MNTSVSQTLIAPISILSLLVFAGCTNTNESPDPTLLSAPQETELTTDQNSTATDSATTNSTISVPTTAASTTITTPEPRTRPRRSEAS